MEYTNDNLNELLDYIDPASVDYQTWLGIGMALKDSGYSVDVWENWSALDSARYHHGECAKKWKSFNGSDNPVTAGTIVFLAQQNGYIPTSKSNYNGAMEWDDCIFTSPEMTAVSPIHEPINWNPIQEMTKYLEILFEPDDFVSYVTESFINSAGKLCPTKGTYTRTAGQLLESLQKHENFEETFGTINPECGAWIRFNPMDGKGTKNENVAEYRYALVESDTISIEQQIGIIHDLQLPVAVMVHVAVGTIGKPWKMVCSELPQTCAGIYQNQSFRYSAPATGKSERRIQRGNSDFEIRNSAGKRIF